MTSNASSGQSSSDYPARCPACHQGWGSGYGTYSCDCDQSQIDLLNIGWRTGQENLTRFQLSLPARYRRYIDTPLPDAFTARNAEMVSAAQALTPGSNLYLYGQAGQGKTHMAVHTAARMIAGTKLRALFVGEVGYFEQVFGEFSGRAEAPNLLTPDVLVYDDLGKQKPSEFALQKIYHMLEMRWAGERTLILTSNFKPSVVSARLCGADFGQAEAVQSRLVAGHVFEVGADEEADHRFGSAL